MTARATALAEAAWRDWLLVAEPESMILRDVTTTETYRIAFMAGMRAGLEIGFTEPRPHS